MALNEIPHIGRSEEPVRRLDEARYRLYSRCSWRPMFGIAFGLVSPRFASLTEAYVGIIVLYQFDDGHSYRPSRGNRGTALPRFAVLMEAYGWS